MRRVVQAIAGEKDPAGNPLVLLIFSDRTFEYVYA